MLQTYSNQRNENCTWKFSVNYTSTKCFDSETMVQHEIRRCSKFIWYSDSTIDTQWISVPLKFINKTVWCCAQSNCDLGRTSSLHLPSLMMHKHTNTEHELNIFHEICASHYKHFKWVSQRRWLTEKVPELKYFIKILSPFLLIIQTEPISIGLDVMQVNLFAYEIMQEKNNNNN